MAIVTMAIEYRKYSIGNITIIVQSNMLYMDFELALKSTLRGLVE